MPRVGKKTFPYTKKGIADAKAYAKEKDLPIIHTEDNKAGMSIPGYAEGGGVRFYESQGPSGGGTPDLHSNFGSGSIGGGGGKGGGGGAQEEAAATEEEYQEPEENEEFTGCEEGQIPDGEGGCKDVVEEETGEEETGEEEPPVPEETPETPESTSNLNLDNTSAGQENMSQGLSSEQVMGQNKLSNQTNLGGGLPGVDAPGTGSTPSFSGAGSSGSMSLGKLTSGGDGVGGDKFKPSFSGGSMTDKLSSATEGVGSKLGDATEGLGDKLGDATEGLGDKLGDVADSATGKKGMVVKKKIKMGAKINRKYKGGGVIYETEKEAIKAGEKYSKTGGMLETSKDFYYYQLQDNGKLKKVSVGKYRPVANNSSQENTNYYNENQKVIDNRKGKRGMVMKNKYKKGGKVKVKYKAGGKVDDKLSIIEKDGATANYTSYDEMVNSKDYKKAENGKGYSKHTYWGTTSDYPGGPERKVVNVVEFNTEMKRKQQNNENNMEKGGKVKVKKKDQLSKFQRDFLNNKKSERAKLKTNTPGRKMNKGGKVKANKKGIAIIIAMGKPKINRKKQ